MILAAQHIRALALSDQKMISPFHERKTAGGMTFGLSPAGYDIRVAQAVALNPGNFVLASSIEHFNIPNGLQAIVHDKSTLARRGLAVQNTVLEPGWRGYITLELSNHGFEFIMLAAETPIAQVVFHQLSAPTEQPYEGKYQDQKAGPVNAIWEY